MLMSMFYLTCIFSSFDWYNQNLLFYFMTQLCHFWNNLKIIFRYSPNSKLIEFTINLITLFPVYFASMTIVFIWLSRLFILHNIIIYAISFYSYLIQAKKRRKSSKTNAYGLRLFLRIYLYIAYYYSSTNSKYKIILDGSVWNHWKEPHLTLAMNPFALIYIYFFSHLIAL